MNDEIKNRMAGGMSNREGEEEPKAVVDVRRPRCPYCQMPNARTLWTKPGADGCKSVHRCRTCQRQFEGWDPADAPAPQASADKAAGDVPAADKEERGTRRGRRR